MRRRKRTLRAKRAKKVVENKVRGELRKNKAEDTAQHRAVRSGGRIQKRERTTEVEQNVSHFRNRRARHRVAMAMIPGTIHSPLSLAVQSRGS